MRMSDVLSVARQLRIDHNVCIRVIDEETGTIVSEHTGHNAATNTMLIGIGKYLIGNSTVGQGWDAMRQYIPRYISLGTMGLRNQLEDYLGLPDGIGERGRNDIELYSQYMSGCPGYGADGYDGNANNGRTEFGLGLPYTSYDTEYKYREGALVMYKGKMYRCLITGTSELPGLAAASWELYRDDIVNFELITPNFPRTQISFKDVVPEVEAELPETVDVVFSAMISTGALSQFRGDRDYIFISEVGLWSTRFWNQGASNGLLAGYRIIPPNRENWDMQNPVNREILQKNILKVGRNQVVQVIWKIQLGSLQQFRKDNEYVYYENRYLKWHPVEDAHEDIEGYISLGYLDGDPNEPNIGFDLGTDYDESPHWVQF